MDQVLAVSQLYVDLRQQEQRGKLELIEFQAEPACRRRYMSGDRSVTLKPDAYVVTAVGDFERYQFAEIDRGTESLSVVRRKAEAYVEYWRLGIEAERLGVFPQVVWLVPDKSRKVVLVRALARVPAEEWQMYEVRSTEAPMQPTAPRVY